MAIISPEAPILASPVCPPHSFFSTVSSASPYMVGNIRLMKMLINTRNTTSTHPLPASPITAAEHISDCLSNTPAFVHSTHKRLDTALAEFQLVSNLRVRHSTLCKLVFCNLPKFCEQNCHLLQMLNCPIKCIDKSIKI